MSSNAENVSIWWRHHAWLTDERNELSKPSTQINMVYLFGGVIIAHDDVIKWKLFRVTGPLCGEFTGPGEFPTQRLVTRSFDVFFDLHKRLSKQHIKMNRYAVIRSMVWCNISGTTISHVLRINCVSMAHGWRTYAGHMAYEWRCHCVWMSRTRTLPLRIHDRSGVCTVLMNPTYTLGSMGHGGCMVCVHAEPINTPHYICELWMWHLNVKLNTYVS